MFAENIPTAGEIVQYDIQNEAMETNKIDLSTAHLTTHLQKQPPEMFLKKSVFKNFTHKNSFIYISTELYSDFNIASKIEFFPEIVNGFQSFTIIAKSSISRCLTRSKYTSVQGYFVFH